MNKYLMTMIINCRSSLRRNNRDVFSIIRDTFQDEDVNSYKSFKRANIKNDNDLIIAYHEKRVADASEDYILAVKELFKDSEIKKPVVTADDFYA